MGNILVNVSQRQALRRAVRFDCQVVRERDFRLLGEWALDLSNDGMLVVSNADVLTGEEVVVSFKVPRSSIYVDAEATVARVVHGRRPSDRHRRALGISFASLDDAARRMLRASLRGLPPPLPTRRPRIDYAASIHMAALT
jgi:hypothetical protein